MTRDEAIYKIENTVVFSDRWAANHVDVLVALGLLKLSTDDETTRVAAIHRLDGMFVMTDSAVDDARKNNMPRRLNTEGAAEIIDILTKSGFRITR